MSYWIVKKTHSKQYYNDTDEYSLFVNDKVEMTVCASREAEQMQNLANIHNKEIMNINDIKL